MSEEKAIAIKRADLTEMLLNVKDFTTVGLSLIKRGIAVVPTQSGLRFPNIPEWQNKATTEEAQVRAWGEEDRSYNCCCVAKFGGVGMYDIDDMEACVAKGMPPLPETFTVRSPSGGTHGYFIHTSETEALGTTRDVKDDKKNKIFEFKGHNAACCAPGCIRDDGGVYKIDKEVALTVGLSPELLRWIEQNSAVKAKGGVAKRKFHPDFEEQDLFDHFEWTFAGDFWKGNLHYFIFSECPIKGGAHDDQVRSKKCCLIIGDQIGFDCKVCGEEYGWRELIKYMEGEGIAPYPYYIFADEDDELLLQEGGIDMDEAPTEVEERAEESKPEVPEVNTTGFHFECTDTGNAERLVRRFGHSIRFVRDQGAWRVWDGKRWKIDRRNKVDRLTKQIVRELHEEAADAEGDEAKAKYAWAFKSGGRDRRNAMVALAAMEMDIVTVTTDYDRDPWLFNVQNGVIDLRTGKLLPHNRKQLHSKISSVTYDPTATCPMFDKFLNEIMDGDAEMISFLAAATGYSLTGDIKEQATFFSHGNGQNGKSVLNNVVKNIMGDYAEVASFDTFVVKKNDNGPKNDLAKLVGARLVFASESKEGQSLDEALIKSVTGGEEITVRFLHKEYFSYTPQFKVWMSSNNKPAIRGTDWGIWRRMKLIPFEVTIEEKQKDKFLGSKLRKEASGILNWMLKGLEHYREGGLVSPEKVKAATRQYKDSQDVVGQFLQAKCVLGSHAEIRGSELYANYKRWAEANREYAMKESKFTESILKVPGITKTVRKEGKWYVGVGQTELSRTYDQIPEDAEVF